MMNLRLDDLKLLATQVDLAQKSGLEIVEMKVGDNYVYLRKGPINPGRTTPNMPEDEKVKIEAENNEFYIVGISTERHNGKVMRGMN